MVNSTKSERSWLGSHFDDLTTDQSRAFDRFTKLCESNDLTWPVSVLDKESEGGVNDDTTLLCVFFSGG